jgi:hypothetical protein
VTVTESFAVGLMRAGPRQGDSGTQFNELLQELRMFR